MIDEPKHKFHGTAMSEWIAFTPGGLDDDVGVGLVTIVHAGRHGFGLERFALIDFVRRSLYTLVERGAKPRHWGTSENPDRGHALHYGADTPSEIVEGVIADWLASGGGDLEWSDFRFTLPKFDAWLDKAQSPRR